MSIGASQLLYSAEQIARRVQELALVIRQEWGEQPMLLVGVMTGALPFVADLARALGVSKVEIGLVRASSYGRSTTSSGRVGVDLSWLTEVSGRDILLVDDILDSGRTLQALKTRLLDDGAHSVRMCVLLDKPSRRVVDVRADWVGWCIPDHFVVGYGLDLDGKYRHLPDIRILEHV